jgi:hypothetical protein
MGKCKGGFTYEKLREILGEEDCIGDQWVM